MCNRTSKTHRKFGETPHRKCAFLHTTTNILQLRDKTMTQAVVMDFSKIGQAAATSEDMTVNKTFERELPKAGVALCRLLSYVETGRHESTNPTHKPSLRAILTFELSHKKHLIEIDGKFVPSTVQVRVNKGVTSKSGFRKLFNVMNDACGGDHQHMAEMIGKPFLAEIFHNTVGEGDKAKTYANFDKDGAYSFKEPVRVDLDTEEKTPINVMELHGTPSCFLWENEAITDDVLVAMWESIYIEGTREVEDPKTKEKKEVSKNWIQETIMSNLEWEGSRTQALTQEHIVLDEHLTLPEETNTTSKASSSLADAAVNGDAFDDAIIY